jgi:hypothetical protein
MASINRLINHGHPQSIPVPEKLKIQQIALLAIYSFYLQFVSNANQFHEKFL